MIGTVLGNRYELEEKVGIGGMAIVYKAMDRLLNRYVAVKLLRSEFQSNEEFIRRFNIESQAAASLSHANIVSIYDVGQSGHLQYIVMEFIEGKTLKDYIEEKKGNIYWKEATDISMQICAALDHAHSKHIIHRDIKPQNIMINDEGIIKVTDFGIARAASNGTTTMEAMGSAHYLSPEQARGGYTDQRSDIYSLGVVLYELFTGKLPFDGETPVAVAMQHMQTEPVKPRVINPDIPKSIENIILKAMSKEQRLRYESASQMLSDIKKAYADPDSSVKVSEDDTEKFGTKIIPPIVNITMPGEADKNAKTVVRRTNEQSETVERKTKKKESKKKDTIAVIAAVITCLVIACVMGVVVANVIGNRNRVGNNEIYLNMPNVRGLSEDEANDMLKHLRNAGVDIEEVYVYDSNVKKGEVIDQSPRMGDITPDEKVIITISKGLEEINLDDYTGKKAEDIVSELEAKGIDVKTSEEMSDEVEEGYIIRQLPTVGQVVETGDSVRIFVSSGPNKFALNDYVGMESGEASEELELQGITVKIEHEFNDEIPVGVVVRQSPEPTTEMMKGNGVILYVSSGPEQVQVPKLIGLMTDSAQDALTNKNLKLGSVSEMNSDRPKGEVISQSVAEGTQVAKNTAVNIVVSNGALIVVPDNNANVAPVPDADANVTVDAPVAGNISFAVSDTGL